MSTASSALWGNIVSGAGVFVVTAGLLGTWVNQRVTPIEDRINAIDRRLDKIDETITSILTLDAKHTADLAAMQRGIDGKLDTELFRTSREGLLKQIDGDKSSVIRVMDELSHQIHVLEEKIVSRDENKEHWDAEATEKEDINKRLTDINARINALTTQAPAPVGPPR